MIDTVKIYSAISKDIYNIIYNNSIVKSSVDRKYGEIMYEIVNDHLEGSYSSSLSVRVGSSAKYLSPLIATLIGLIPNCASSVILTELFIEKIITMPMLISGVAVNAGVGLVVLFKTNKNIKENLKIVGLLYGIGVISGMILQVIL